MSDRARRWLTWAIVAVLAAIACTFLGLWQYSRYETKARNVALVQENFTAAPRELSQLLPGGAFDPDLEWAPARLSGEFVGDPVILPQRGIAGHAGDHVLTLFELSDTGQTVVIDRGWYPVGAPPKDLAPPAGEVTVIGRARPAEPASPRGVRDHQVFAVDATQVIEAQGGAPAQQVQATVYFMADAGAPGQAGLGSFPRPAADLGNHLSYTFQWWIFGIGAFVGLGVVIRRDIRAQSGRPTSTRRVSVDASEEDALIDAQLGGVDPDAPAPHPPAPHPPDAPAGGVVSGKLT